ncbi:MAG TPA: PEP/pyruvate-binding domain-containing protein [Vitreimonas sp.]|nr:PEP/pyruvate-binding domain-containing protein [Vitreimonas sp.]
MSIPALIYLADYSTYPSGTIGRAAKQLGEIVGSDFQLPPSFLIPSSTLFQIQKGQFPKPIALEILKAYHEYLHHGFVQIRPSYIVKAETAAFEQNIHGDTNLLESIVECAKFSGLTPLIIEYQPQAQVAGKIYTCHPHTHSKATLIVEAAWGVYSDEQPADVFEIDVRTWHITGRMIATKSTHLTRQLNDITPKTVAQCDQSLPCLADKDIITIAKGAYHLKQRYPHHLVVEFSQEKTQFFITDFQELQLQEKIPTHPLPLPPATTKQPTVYRPKIVGKTLQMGKVTGLCRVVTSKADRQALQTGEIVVVERGTYHLLPTLAKASAIISEKRITSPTLLKAIKAYGVPTLSPAPKATQVLHTHQRVLLHTITPDHGIVV